MNILEQVEKEIVSVMKDKENSHRKITLSTLKLLKSEIINYNRDNKDGNELKVVIKEISKREKAIEEVKKKSKDNENDKFIIDSLFEISILKKYVPIEYTEEELIQVISLAILATNAISKKDIKNVMNELSCDIRVNKGKASKLISSMLI